jgi:hypothetical protein
VSVVEELKTVEQWEGFFDSFKANVAPMVYDSGENLTFTAADLHVHPEQPAWARQMQTGIHMPVDGRSTWRSATTCAARRS